MASFKREHDHDASHEDIYPSTERLHSREPSLRTTSTQHNQKPDPELRTSTSIAVGLPSPEDSNAMSLEEPQHSNIVPQLPTPSGEGPCLDDDLLALGVRSRKLIKAIQKLETLQITATLPSLPKFVVVGDQSAGKSSIIEALCDISLPRNEGTCTRCPFQITTTSSSNQQSTGSAWTCVVTLQTLYSFDQTRRRDALFQHWQQQQEMKTSHFATVTNKQELAELLVRAQLATLNPDVDPQRYATASTVPQTIQVEFSPNLVCLDISGPELPDMSFYDLPGTINVVGDPQQQHLVSLVEHTVKAYISDPKALVLLACAADQDIETSTTFRFIRQCGAEGRCLGVLTKADLVGEHRVTRINDILENSSFRLHLGWFITKQLSSAQIVRGITHSQARSLEKSFFEARPWATLPAAQAGRYGISNLQDAISERLTEHIRQDMPEIIGRVRERLVTVHQELALFGERDANPLLTVRDVVRNIADSVSNHVQGRANRAAFFAKLGTERIAMRKGLSNALPNLDMTSPDYKAASFAVNLCDDDDEGTATMGASFGTPTPAQSTSQRSCIAATPTPIRNKRKAPELTTPRSDKRGRVESAAEVVSERHVFKLNEVEEIIRNNSDNSLMIQASTEVNNILIGRLMEGWDQVLNSVLERIRRLILDMMDAAGREQLNKYGATLLYSKTLEALQDFGTTAIDREFSEIHRLLQCERFRPMTSRELRDAVENLKKQLNRKRQERRVKEYFDTMEATTERAINDAERKKRSPDVAADLPSDPYAASIDAFALPQTYYQVAAPRFNDNVFQRINFYLLHETIQHEIGDVLMAKLNATDAEVCAQLLSEHPERELQRQQLLAEKNRLDSAMCELHDLRNE